METTVQVVLYTRPGCHLCDEMKQEMTRADCVELYALEEIDIAGDAELLSRYQFEIPVLWINGVEAFRHRLQAAEFKAYVTALAGRAEALRNAS